MKEFDYDLDYKSLDFTDAETRKLYRIGRGEQGVLLVRPYTNEEEQRKVCKEYELTMDEDLHKKYEEFKKLDEAIAHHNENVVRGPMGTVLQQKEDIIGLE